MVKRIEINTEFIKLDQFIKWCGITGSGGEAHEIIFNGEVKVNGEVEIRRGKKIRAGDTVEVLENMFKVYNKGEQVDN